MDDDFTKQEIDSLATRRSATNEVKEINQIIKEWKKEKRYICNVPNNFDYLRSLL